MRATGTDSAALLNAPEIIPTLPAGGENVLPSCLPFSGASACSSVQSNAPQSEPSAHEKASANTRFTEASAERMGNHESSYRIYQPQQQTLV